ncbi:MAG: hypothetical protein KatS3mg076_1513 [Candidatus Binatia bacterium]|nr:MAG: hypothetical protein KatS3mg076_1513 [Candidatus Binatia bacterium]
MRARLALALLASLAVWSCGGDSPEQDFLDGVSVREEVFLDPSRPTPPTANFPGSEDRTLRTLVWFPEGIRGPLPLLLLAHGFGGLPEKFDAFARSVARGGFVVAAPAFPLTNQNAPGGHEVGFSDFTNEPGDLSFVLDELLEAGADAGHPLGGRIDAGRIAVLGHSLGGAAAFALGRKVCCRDERVRATILVAAAWSLHTAFGGTAFDPGPPPTLLLHGTQDRTLAIASSEALYELLSPPRIFLGIEGGGHSDGLESQEEPPVVPRRVTQEATLAFLRAVFFGEVAELEKLLERLRAEGHDVRFDGIELLSGR